MDKNIKSLKSSVKNARKIALFSHENPDPDTVGSTVALLNAFTKIGKTVSLFCETEVSGNYLFLKETENYNKDEFLPENFDMVIAVDVATSKMLGRYEDDFLKNQNSFRIDHHIGGDNFAKTNIVLKTSACANLIYYILKLFKINIDESIATPLFLGLCGDTGIFRNNGTDSESFEIASKLINCGANIRRVYDEFFDKKTVSVVKMTSNSLLNAEVDDNFKFAILTATAENYKKFNVPENDNLGNLPLTYLSCGYNIAVILKEKEDGIHCSFRSKPDFDVSCIASKFGGGGHKNASGCKLDCSLVDAKEQVIKEIKNYLKSNEN